MRSLDITGNYATKNYHNIQTKTKNKQTSIKQNTKEQNQQKRRLVVVYMDSKSDI